MDPAVFSSPVRDRLPVILDHAPCFAALALAGDPPPAVCSPGCVFAGTPRRRRSQGVPMVRDAEIEALVRDYARPIFKAAGLSKSGIDIILVNDPRFNAFVAGRRMFINTGALLAAETPNEIIGVIAHEAGHIAGGHQERLRHQLARAQTMAIVGTLLGVGAVAAGAATDNSGLARRASASPPAARDGAAQPARLSALRRSDGRPLGGHLSREDRPVGKRDAEDVPAFPERAVACRARRSTPIRSAIRCRASASPISRRWRQQQPQFRCVDPPACSFATT